jgi:hypothetical protein
VDFITITSESRFSVHTGTGYTPIDVGCVMFEIDTGRGPIIRTRAVDHRRITPRATIIAEHLLIEEGFDAVVRSGEIEDSRLKSRLLGHFRMLLVGAPGYFARHGKPMHPSELSSHACIQFRMPDTGKLQSWQLRREPNEPEQQFATKLTCNSNEARLCFALEGLGIAYMSEFSVRAALDTGALVTVLDEYTTEQNTYWAALDCPTGFAGVGAQHLGMTGAETTLLGRMSARIERRPCPGDRCIIVAWPTGRDGRKLFASSALLSSGGEILAVAQATWLLVGRKVQLGE